MTELTGLFALDWATVFFVLLGLMLAAMSARRDVHGVRVGPVLVSPFVAGTLLVATIVIAKASEISRFLPFLGRPITALLSVATAFVAFAVVDLLFSRFVKLPALVWRTSSPRWLPDVWLAIVVGVAVLASGFTLFRISASTYVEPPATGFGASISVEATHPLPSGPLDVELLNDHEGYVSLGTRVSHFELPDEAGGSLVMTTVAEGFTYSRGLAIVGDVLVVGDLGPLPCPEPIPLCKGHTVPGVNLVEGERLILEGSNARLLAFDIQPDGSLKNRRVLLDHLPVVNTEHGLNGVELGPDGLLYVAIGNLDQLPMRIARTVDHPKQDLLGTVIRLSPGGGNVEVFATGLRNVFGLAFDEEGGLWGVDNDGATPSGWRAEEVLHIRNGRNYGYPREGSFGPFEVRDDFAVWYSQGTGSAGIIWANEVGLGPGLLIGSCGWLDGLRLTDRDGEWVVVDRSAYVRLLELPGCVSDLEPLGDDRLIASVFGIDSLYVLAVDA